MLNKSLKTQIRLARELISRDLVKLAFNPSSYLIKKKPKSVKIILRMCTILVLNKEESCLLVKNGNLEKLRKLGPEIVVVTNKDKAIECYDGRVKYKIKPHKVKVVERTGAGDAFASGFVAGIVKNLSIEESLKIALKNSENVLRGYGAKSNLLRWKDVK